MPARPATARAQSVLRKSALPATAAEQFSSRPAKCVSTFPALAAAALANFALLARPAAAKAASVTRKQLMFAFPQVWQMAGVCVSQAKGTQELWALQPAIYIWQ